MTTTEQRKIPAPLINPESAPFYEAAARGEFLVGKCKACGELHYYPRRLCPHCFSDQTEWIPAKGGGSIYTYSTMHRGVPIPYTIAYVTLDEGVTVLTGIVDFAPGSLKIGQKVKAVFKQAEGGATVPMFAPA